MSKFHDPNDFSTLSPDVSHWDDMLKDNDENMLDALTGIEAAETSMKFVAETLRGIEYQIACAAAQAQKMIQVHRIERDERRKNKEYAAFGVRVRYTKLTPVIQWYKVAFLYKEGSKKGDPGNTRKMRRVYIKYNGIEYDMRTFRQSAPDWEYQIIQELEPHLKVLRQEIRNLVEARMSLRQFARRFKLMHKDWNELWREMQ